MRISNKKYLDRYSRQINIKSIGLAGQKKIQSGNVLIIGIGGLGCPLTTYLAASGIGDFRYIMKWNELNSPLKRNVTQNEVGKAALFLLSDMSSGVTGENLHVDAGYHIVGMKAEDAPDIDVVTGRKE